LIPTRPGLWLFRHNGAVHASGHEERIPIVYRRLEDGRVFLEPYGTVWPDMTLQDFEGAGDWMGWAGDLRAALAPLGDSALLRPDYTEPENREVLFHNYRLELMALPDAELITRAFLDNGRGDWERRLAREERVRRAEVEGPFR
jgi:hypothetical protein